jgi:CDP-diacylglycerol--glycerol-3-phosphate 3-phosphatidyltransferase
LLKQALLYLYPSSHSSSPYHPPWIRKLPNRLTFLRILCIPAVVFLMMQGVAPEPVSFYHFWPIPLTPSVTDILSGAVFSLAALTDFFDGWIARKFHVETVLGKLLDPLADKLLVVSALIILVEKHRLLGWVAVILIVRDLGINAIRISALDEGIYIPSSWLGKFKTVFQDLGIIGLTFHGPWLGIPFHILGQCFICLALFSSVGSGIQYLWVYGQELKKKSLL